MCMRDRNKGGLHVQGRSYWAPCNIGPYSQSIWLSTDANQVSYISGQIGLVPQSMKMKEPSTDQTILALQHFDTLCKTIGAQEKLYMTCYISDESILDYVCKTWALYCSRSKYESDLWKNKTDDDKECLIIVKISELPRGAVSEWGGVTCKKLIVDDIDVEEQGGAENKNILHSFRKLNLNIEYFHDIAVSLPGSQKHFTTGFVDDREKLALVLERTSKSAQVTLYYSPGETIAFYHHVEYYPVEKIFDCDGKEHRFALHIRS